MKNKKGFISTSIIYSFFLVFILLMIAILMSFANKNFLIEKVGKNIKIQNPDIIACTKEEPLKDCLFKAEYISLLEIQSKARNICEECSIKEAFGGNSEEYNYWKINVNIASDCQFNDIDCMKAKVKYKVANSTEGSKVNYELGLYANNDSIYDASTPYKTGTTYYYRGAENDNYVVFADKLWSIIRINGDESIRLIYQGEWDKIKDLTTVDKKNYIKNYSYIDLDLNNNLTSNDARHYNVNKISELECDYYEWKSDICNKYSFLNCDSGYTVSKNCGTTKHNGATSLWNVGYLKNGSTTTDYDEKLENKEGSDLYKYLTYWYTNEIAGKSDESGLSYDNFVETKSVFCANKDIIFKSGENYLLVNFLPSSFWENLTAPPTTAEAIYCTGSSSSMLFSKNSTVILSPHINPYNNLQTVTQHSVYGSCPNTDDDEAKFEYFTQSAYQTVYNMSNLICPYDGNSYIAGDGFGLISSQELNFAGAKFRETNTDFYLNTNFSYWTSDMAFGNNNINTKAYYFAWNGDSEKQYLTVMDDSVNTNVAYVKPVINLKANVKYLDGNGSIDNPYIIGVE